MLAFWAITIAFLIAVLNAIRDSSLVTTKSPSNDALRLTSIIFNIICRFFGTIFFRLTNKVRSSAPFSPTKTPGLPVSIFN